MKTSITRLIRRSVAVGLLAILTIVISQTYANDAKPQTLTLINTDTVNLRVYDMQFSDDTNFTGKLGLSIIQNQLPNIAISGTYDAASDTLAVNLPDLPALGMASTSLKLSSISVSRNSLTATSAKLKLPEKLGGVEAELGNVVIDQNGLRIGEGNVDFSLPDITIGGSTGFAMSGAKGNFTIADDRSYKLTVSGSVMVKLPSNSVSVTGSLWLDSAGGLGGRLDAFELNIAGLTLGVKNIDLRDDGSLAIGEAVISTPAKWNGGPGAKIENLVISANAPYITFSSAKFVLPTIKAGGFTLGSIIGELSTEGDGFVISGAGSFELPSVGAPGCTGFDVKVTIYVPSGTNTTVLEFADLDSVDRIAYYKDLRTYQLVMPMESSGFGLREASLSVKCNIPIPQTPFFITGVRGSLTLTSDVVSVKVGLEVSAGTKVAGVSILSVDGEVGLSAKPLELAVSGTIKVLGFSTAGANATINTSGFTGTIYMDVIVARGNVTIKAWLDSRGTHLTGTGYMELGIPKGKILSQQLPATLRCPNGVTYVPVIGPCWGYQAKLVLGGSLDIPPEEYKLGSVLVEAGEFHNGQWGFKGTASVRFSGKEYKKGFFIDTKGNLSFTNVDNFQLVTPTQVAQALRAWESARSSGVQLDAVELNGQSFAFPASGELYITAPITGTRDATFMLTRSGDEPTFSLLRPDGTLISPTTQLDNVSYEENTAYTGTLYPYTPPSAVAAVGQTNPWYVQTTGSDHATLSASPTLRPLSSTLQAPPDMAAMSGLIATPPSATQLAALPLEGRVRMIHAAPDAPAVAVHVDNVLAMEGLTYRDVSQYASLAAGSHTFSITSGSTTLLSHTVEVVADHDYLLVIGGSGSSLQAALLADQNRPLPTDTARLRFVNLSPDAGPADLALASATVLTDSNNIAFMNAGQYFTLSAGAYSFEVRVANTPMTLLTNQAATLNQNSVYSLFLLGQKANGTLQLAVSRDDTDAIAHLRFVQAVAGASLDVRLNNGESEGQIYSALPFGIATTYTSQYADTYQVTVEPTGTSSTRSLPELIMEDGKDYTVIAVDRANLHYYLPIVMQNSATRQMQISPPNVQADPQDSIELVAIPDDNTLPAVGNARVRLVNLFPDVYRLSLAATGGPANSTSPTLLNNVAFKSASSYTSLAAGTYKVELRSASQLLLSQDVKLDAGNVYSLLAIGTADGRTLNINLDVQANREVDVAYYVDGAEDGQWKMVLCCGNLTEGSYATTYQSDVPAPELFDVAVEPLPGNQARVSWKVTSPDESALVNIYANDGEISQDLGDGAVVPLYDGEELMTEIDSPVDGSLQTAVVDLSQLSSGAYYIYVEVEDSRNEPIQLYAADPLLIDNTGSWPSSWNAIVTMNPTLDLNSPGVEITWNLIDHPDANEYRFYWGFAPGDLTEEEYPDDAAYVSIDALDQGDTIYFVIGAYDTETNREVRSQKLSYSVPVAEFSFSTAYSSFNLVSGNERVSSLILTTSLESYPDAVYLSAGDALPDGVDIDFETEFVVPTLAGATVPITISVSSDLPSGTYTLPIDAVGGGAAHTLNIQVVVTAPGYDLSLSTHTITLNGATPADLQISAIGMHGESALIFLDVLREDGSSLPANLSADFLPDVLVPGTSGVLKLTNSGALASGTYVLKVVGDNGDQVVEKLLTVIIT